jgi:hypothetical protein
MRMLRDMLRVTTIFMVVTVALAGKVVAAAPCAWLQRHEHIIWKITLQAVLGFK